MPGDKGWKPPEKTVETLPLPRAQVETGSMHVDEKGKLQTSESGFASIESEPAIDATEEYLRMSPDQIRVTLTVLFKSGNTTEYDIKKTLHEMGYDDEVIGFETKTVKRFSEEKDEQGNRKTVMDTINTFRVKSPKYKEGGLANDNFIYIGQ